MLICQTNFLEVQYFEFPVPTRLYLEDDITPTPLLPHYIFCTAPLPPSPSPHRTQSTSTACSSDPPLVLSWCYVFPSETFYVYMIKCKLIVLGMSYFILQLKSPQAVLSPSMLCLYLLLLIRPVAPLSNCSSRSLFARDHALPRVVF